MESDLMHQYLLPCGSRENSLWLEWLESLTIFQAFFSNCLIDVLDGWESGPSIVLGYTHNPLLHHAFEAGAVAKQ